MYQCRQTNVSSLSDLFGEVYVREKMSCLSKCFYHFMHGLAFFRIVLLPEGKYFNTKFWLAALTVYIEFAEPSLTKSKGLEQLAQLHSILLHGTCWIRWPCWMIMVFDDFDSFNSTKFFSNTIQPCWTNKIGQCLISSLNVPLRALLCSVFCLLFIFLSYQF